jgi:hypothetical protein
MAGHTSIKTSWTVAELAKQITGSDWLVLGETAGSSFFFSTSYGESAAQQYNNHMERLQTSLHGLLSLVDGSLSSFYLVYSLLSRLVVLVCVHPSLATSIY